MKFLNLGCGGERPQDEQWVNLDDLHSQLPEGQGARDALNEESNYVNFVVGSDPLPFDAETFDGILASHFFEHFDAQQSIVIMEDCKRILKHGGALLISVPDAIYFRKVYDRDRKDKWPELFDVSDPENGYSSFFRAALWFEQHKVILTEDALWCYFVRAGFALAVPEVPFDILEAMKPHLNRRKFSLEMVGIKP